MQPRAFNNIFINYEARQLVKASSKSSKLQDEIDYYLNLPGNLLNLFPKLLTYAQDYSSYTLEYIPSKCLAEQIFDNQISMEDGEKILRKLLQILTDIHNSQPSSNFNNIDSNVADFYINKTMDRVEHLENDTSFKSLINTSTIKINGKSYRSFEALKSEFIQFFRDWHIESRDIVTIHGDFCFSNILYCPVAQEIRLIDPRGSFLSKGVHGHLYYDYAKLMHSIHSGYEFIINNNFELSENSDGNFTFNRLDSPLLKSLHRMYRDWLKTQNVILNNIYLIEASLFLSMASLHYENPLRQKALFLTGIIILNDFFDSKYENMYRH